MLNNKLVVRQMGLVAYASVLEDMRKFTLSRDESSPDEVWLLEHKPVFTQGLNGKSIHILDSGDIPVVKVDRGGQVTYHGPGQLIAYIMMDLNRKGWGVRQLVSAIEKSVVDLLQDYSIRAYSKSSAPGVYVNLNGKDAKIASLGLRIKHGRSYHGVSLNVDMDIEPFSRINPCGHAGLQITQISDLANPGTVEEVANGLLSKMIARFGYEKVFCWGQSPFIQSNHMHD